MATDRLAILRQMVEGDPNNSFARYGLAMELANKDRLDDAIEQYQILFARDEEYAAAYFHGGQAYEKLGRLEEARRTYEKGIEVTTRKGDLHTRAEIQAALELLPL